jgi:hypothetical protein
MRGISAKDFTLHIAELTLPDALMQTFLGDYYADETADAPSYEWIKIQVTTEPINENSICTGVQYVTAEFNAIADFKCPCMLDSCYIDAHDESGNQVVDYHFYYDNEKNSSSEQATGIEYATTFLNLLFYGGTNDTSYDIYSKKGFHKFDEEWKSLEDETRIPRIVNKHSDLPSLFIENGIMAVANEEIIVGQSTTKLESNVPVSIKVNPKSSVRDEIEKLKQYCKQKYSNEYPDNEYPDNDRVELCGSFYGVDQTVGYFRIAETPYYNGLAEASRIEVRKYDETEPDLGRYYYYFDESEVTFHEAHGYCFTTDEGGCWYYIKTNRTLPISQLCKVEDEDWISLSDIMVLCDRMTLTRYSASNDIKINYVHSYEFANLFKFYDSKPLVYPKGFYRYNNTRWYYHPEISGESFDNSEVLKRITDEDVDNIHTHDNKDYLDMLTDDSYIHNHSGLERATRNYPNYIYDPIEIAGTGYQQVRLSPEKFTDIQLSKSSLDINTFEGYKLFKSDNSSGSYIYTYTIPEFRFAVNVNSPTGLANLYIKSTNSSSPSSIQPITYMGYDNGEQPVFENGYRYEFSLVNGVAVVGRTPLQGG